MPNRRECSCAAATSSSGHDRSITGGTIACSASSASGPANCGDCPSSCRAGCTVRSRIGAHRFGTALVGIQHAITWAPHTRPERARPPHRWRDGGRPESPSRVRERSRRHSPRGGHDQFLVPRAGTDTGPSAPGTCGSGEPHLPCRTRTSCQFRALARKSTMPQPGSCTGPGTSSASRFPQDRTRALRSLAHNLPPVHGLPACRGVDHRCFRAMSSRSTCLRTLPVAVIGSWSTSSSRSGNFGVATFRSRK